MQTFSTYVSVALGGALGSVGRVWVGGWFAQRFGDSFPIGTLFVNVSGSFLIGLLSALGTSNPQSIFAGNVRWFLMAGVLGGYTTFSTFSLQTLNLARQGDWLAAAANVFASVMLCLLGVWLGHICASGLNR